MLATVREESAPRSVTVCGGEGRVRHVYTSLSNRVEVRMMAANLPHLPEHYFLLRYEGKLRNHNLYDADIFFYKSWRPKCSF